MTAAQAKTVAYIRATNGWRVVRTDEKTGEIIMRPDKITPVHVRVAPNGTPRLRGYRAHNEVATWLVPPADWEPDVPND
jgi:uncharacterized protein YggE